MINYFFSEHCSMQHMFTRIWKNTNDKKYNEKEVVALFFCNNGEKHFYKNAYGSDKYGNIVVFDNDIKIIKIQISKLHNLISLGIHLESPSDLCFFLSISSVEYKVVYDANTGAYRQFDLPVSDRFYDLFDYIMKFSTVFSNESTAFFIGETLGNKYGVPVNAFDSANCEISKYQHVIVSDMCEYFPDRLDIVKKIVSTMSSGDLTIIVPLSWGGTEKNDVDMLGDTNPSYLSRWDINSFSFLNKFSDDYIQNIFHKNISLVLSRVVLQHAVFVLKVCEE